MKGKYARVYAIIGQINRTGASVTKEQLVSDFTGGKTNSLSSLSGLELSEFEQKLAALAPKQAIQGNYASDPLDRQRKAVIAIFKSIGRTAEDAKAWAEKYGVKRCKKAFNDYTSQELFILIKNAEKVKADYIQGVNKKLI